MSANHRIGILLVFLFGVTLRGSQVSDGRILVADQQQDRLLLIDRATKAVLFENRQLTRVDCVARWSSAESLVCDGPTLVRIDKGLNVVSRLGTTAQRVSAAAFARSNTLLVSDNIRRTVTEIDLARDAAAVWSVDVHWPQAAVRLDTGNTLVADGTPELKEFDRNGDVVRRTALRGWAASLHRLSNGETLVGESGAYELFDRRGSRIWFREWPSKRVTCIQALTAGEILLCDPDARRVVIVDADGQITWESGDVGFPWSAIYLP